MSLSIGSKLGSLEVLAVIGRGGMGEVYRAKDTKLKREVAIKTLPDEFSGDADRLNRFQREAEVLASLNHPNIASIYDLQEAEDSRFLVLELVEGETLADRIAQGPVPMDEALRIATSICEALEAAHERGVIHRDLKPANIKITPEGKVKVLDFGLAKAMQTSPDASRRPLSKTQASNSPTLLSIAPTNAGLILGTAAYMSPEQARGQSVDHRADIFSFGCVFYEMLAGTQAFEGKTVSDILASVLKSEPDIHRLPPNVPPKIRNLVSRCLAKESRQRWQAIGDVRFELEHVDAESEPAAEQRSPIWKMGWMFAAVAVLGLLIMALSNVRQKPIPDAPELRVEITTPPTAVPSEFALSPDGRYIAIVASGGGPQRLWLRPLDKPESQPLPGTEGADFPFWSPDSRSIGFTAAGKLKRIDIAGGAPQVLASTSVTYGGSWNADGTILFNTGFGPLFRVSSSGGEPVAVTRLAGFATHRYPQFLPDGRRFLFFGLGSPEASGIYLGSLDSDQTKLLAPYRAAIFLNPGMIAFIRETTLMAQRVDLTKGELVGDAMRIADVAPGSGDFGFGGFSISANGMVAYRTGDGALRQLKSYDHSGKPLGDFGNADSSTLLYPDLSPDGSHVALARVIDGNQDIWVIDLGRASMTRFTFDPGIDTAPAWSADGLRIAYASIRKGTQNIYAKLSTGAGPEQLLVSSLNVKAPNSWSNDGRFLLYSETDPKSGSDVWALPLNAANAKPIVVANTKFEELNGQFSPDGRWVAYETNESGHSEIVVQAFPEPKSKWQVSTTGGSQARWSADGKQLYFIAPDGKLMASAISTAGESLTAATPIALFTASPAHGAGANKQQYAVFRDGRFLINQQVESSAIPPITLVVNWHPEKR